MKVLVVDDDPVASLLACTVVQALGHDVQTASDGEQAWAVLQSEHVDVVVTDRDMPGLNGLGLCRRLRARPVGAGGRLSGQDGYCYIVMLTGHDSAEQAHEGIAAGADDYLSKPLSGHQLRLRLLAAERVTEVHRQLSLRNLELAAIGDAQYTLARRDMLTALPNRLALQEHLDRLDANLRRHGRGFSVAVFDLDHFKSFNDAAGHAAGDEALRQVTAALVAGVRDTDGLYRYGGEEFVHVIETASVPAAHAAVERLRTRVRELALAHPGRPGECVSVSAGVATAGDGASTSTQQVLEQADAALYQAKRSGRDRTWHAQLPPGASVARTGSDVHDGDPDDLGPSGTTAPLVEASAGVPAREDRGPVLDPEPLEQMRVLGVQIGRDVAGEIAQTWLRQREQRLAALEQAAADGDQPALRRAAHTLKGSSGAIGAVALAGVCRDLELVESWPQRAQLVREAVDRAWATQAILADYLQAPATWPADMTVSRALAAADVDARPSRAGRTRPT